MMPTSARILRQGGSISSLRSTETPGWTARTRIRRQTKTAMVRTLNMRNVLPPRALLTLLDSGIDFAAHFSSLTRLTLRRPAESSNPGLWMQGVYVSLQSDLVILSEWAAVIRATRGTLEHLVLDQRSFAEQIERDGTGDTEFLVRYPYGPGYERFVEHCLPALLEEIKWPNLKSIRLYGFDVPPEMAEKHSSSVKPQKLGLQVEARFKPLGVDVRSGLGRRMLYEEQDGVVSPHEDGLGGRVEEDEVFMQAQTKE
ncbi:hypothetical protein B0H14DRAFT_1287034 [Mycena olivaceomarginata]|nr:hypothetical protein B0H14DRAFT_1287034 [Mycena olivaceomarginata]